jgi:hypothetical protein
VNLNANEATRRAFSSSRIVGLPAGRCQLVTVPKIRLPTPQSPAAGTRIPEVVMLG